jgi:iron complex outermembrane receptor protein
MQRTLLAALAAGLSITPAQAQDTAATLLDAIIVTATRIPTPDVLAPYASEIHTRREIKQSGAASVYDFLAQHTSVQVMPSYGSRSSPLLDMRGYGLENGHENIVVTLDGVRLNNIDLATPLLGEIPLADVESIEIDKGTGSVLFGDNATAGVIQIRTRRHQGLAAAGYVGNFGARGATLSAGRHGEQFSLDLSADAAHQDGDGEADPSGHRDGSRSRSWRARLGFRPTEALQLGLDAAGARLDERYVEPLTLAQFQADPFQAGGTYARVQLDADNWRASAAWDLSSRWKLTAWHAREDKTSNNLKWAWKTDYATDADDLALAYRGGDLDLTLGGQRHDGSRSGTTDRTGKRNTAWYASAQWRLALLTLSAGVRTERVAYSYRPSAGSVLQAGNDLKAWDLGANRRIDDRLSLFADLNRAFQAPDIDRFFTSFDSQGNYTGPQFNGFIRPQISRTLTLGLNHVTAANRLKLDAFRADLDNEIYYYSTGPWSGYNTNLDKTHKEGVELQDSWQLQPDLAAHLNYTYTRAIIDRVGGVGGIFDGKSLPGVPRHAVVLGLTWRPAAAQSVQLNHTWRERTWAIGDFANHNAQRQAAYASTDLAYQWQGRGWGWSAAVNNLFAHRNAVWIADNVIYPVDLSRSYTLGLKAEF